MKVVFRTLGCRLNQYESDALAALFAGNGYQVSEKEEGADVVVVNTCTVTNQSNQKSRYEISHAGRTNPGAKMVITGCMTESHFEQLRQRFPQAIVIRNKGKSGIFQSVDALLKTGNPELCDKDYDLFSYQSFAEVFHTRSLLKIQDGCDNYCTFCIIPRVRGRAVSRPLKAIIENAREVIAKGAKEIVLTGVNISRYLDEGIKFPGLLEKLLALDGDFRVRVSSIEPDNFDEKFYSLVGHPKLAPHLHLCLQSGSNEVLRKMRRMYTVGNFMEIVERVRASNPLFNFTTDVIVGFPGETEKDFEDTLTLSRRVGFGQMHVFKYSTRQGTPAQRMTDHVPGKVKVERARQAHILANELTIAYRSTFDNTVQRVLVEQWKDGMASGYNDYYVPMEFPSGNKKRNRFEIVKAMVKRSQNEKEI